jgi:hypothetical protein
MTLFKKHHSIIFEASTDEPFIIQVEPEACQWTIRRGDKFEVIWSAACNEAPVLVWHGKNCVAVCPPSTYEVRLNGKEAFELLKPDEV